MLKKVLLVLSISLFSLLAFLLSALFFIYLDLPDVKVLENWRPPVATSVYDSKGNYLGDVAVQRRYYVKLEEIPKHVIYAFVAAEDKNFFKHFGIDPIAILRALWINFKRGKIVQGGSTITQQLAKNLFLGKERSLSRKIREALLAIKIERTFSKEKILELYLNQIYLGEGAYGVEAASRVYFGKSVRDLTLWEGALLAGLPKAPSKFDPFKNPELAKIRRNYVLKRMLEDGYITYEEYRWATSKDVVVKRGKLSPRSDYFLDMVKEYLIRKYGEKALVSGWKVYTTLDKDMQSLAEKVVRESIRELSRRYNFPVFPSNDRVLKLAYKRQRYSRKPNKVFVAKVLRVEDLRVLVDINGKKFWLKRRELPLKEGDYVFVKNDEFGSPYLLPDLQGALVSIEAKTGKIKAIVGGVSYSRSQFNRALYARRQPGSAFKPVIYLSALLKGYTQISVVSALPVPYYDPQTGEEWIPRNYDNAYYEEATLREGLAHSINTATVNLLDDIGFDIVLDTASKLGFKDLKPYYSIALGSFEVTPLQLTSAYQVFANLGKRCEPYFIEKIVDSYGNVVEENKPHCEQIFDRATVRVLVDMLRAVVLEGTARGAKVVKRVVAGKTGTTNDFMDAWFVGFTPDLVTGIWVGFDVKESMGEHMSGARVALPIWVKFMSVASLRYPNRDFPLDENNVVVDINEDLLVRADETCQGVPMVFIKGTEPKESCKDILENIIIPEVESSED